jgi:hypothetical protein
MGNPTSAGEQVVDNYLALVKPGKTLLAQRMLSERLQSERSVLQQYD